MMIIFLHALLAKRIELFLMLKHVFEGCTDLLISDSNHQLAIFNDIKNKNPMIF